MERGEYEQEMNIQTKAPSPLLPGGGEVFHLGAYGTLHEVIIIISINFDVSFSSYVGLNTRICVNLEAYVNIYLDLQCGASYCAQQIFIPSINWHIHIILLQITFNIKISMHCLQSNNLYLVQTAQVSSFCGS